MYDVPSGRTYLDGYLVDELLGGIHFETVQLRSIYEALMVVFVEGTCGVLFSFLLVQVFQVLYFKGEVADLLAHPVISLQSMVMTVLILGTVSLLAGFFPARRAASANPMEALRYE